MPLKTTAIDMNALLDAWEAEREALRARPRSTTHVVDFSCGVEQPVDGGVGARSSVRRSPRAGCVAARGTASVPLAAERGPSSLVPSPTPIRAGDVASLPAPEMEPSSPGVVQPVDGGVGARSSVRRSPRTGWVAARGTASVSLAADPAPETEPSPRGGRGDAALSLGEWYGAMRSLGYRDAAPPQAPAAVPLAADGASLPGVWPRPRGHGYVAVSRFRPRVEPTGPGLEELD
jgi:hypothetical protein